MDLDLRILFLFFLFLTGILFMLRSGPVLTPGQLGIILLDFLLVPTAIGTVVVFALLLTRTDPLPFLRQGAYEMSLRQNVNFEEAIPEQLKNSLSVAAIEKVDTDGDAFEEWVVFYRYDLQERVSPIKGIVYDNDRGNPPVIFPYNLEVPDRDYLVEDAGSLQFELAEVVEDLELPEGEGLPEILVSDRNQLTIFRFEENSAQWDFPRDAPPRYRPIGFFRGNIGATASGIRAVSFDEITKNVTVRDRKNFERSQLMVRTVYALNPVTRSYWDSLEPLGSTRRENFVLAAPVVSTIDFFSGPPEEILATRYPEKIVLGFYTATCEEIDLTICINPGAVEWEPEDFLAGEALREFQNDNPGYFGLPSLNNNQRISITHLRYYPELETDPDLLATGQGRDVVTGEHPRFNLVDVGVAVDGSVQMLRFQVELLEDRWKITRRAAFLEPVGIEAPIDIDVIQQP